MRLYDTFVTNNVFFREEGQKEQGRQLIEWRAQRRQRWVSFGSNFLIVDRLTQSSDPGIFPRESF